MHATHGQLGDDAALRRADHDPNIERAVRGFNPDRPAPPRREPAVPSPGQLTPQIQGRRLLRRFIADWPITARTKVVANAGLTWYGTVPDDAPPDASKYRDAQVALQLDQGLGGSSIVGPATFSLAFYYQYQHSPALIEVDPANPIPGVQFVGLSDDAKTVFAEEGDTRLFQATSRK